MSTKHTMGEEWEKAEREAWIKWTLSLRPESPSWNEQSLQYWLSRLSHQREQVLDEIYTLEVRMDENPKLAKLITDCLQETIEKYAEQKGIELSTLKNKDNE